MNAKFLLIIVFIWVTLTFLGSTFEYHDTESDWAGNTEATTTFNYLIDVRNMVVRAEVLGVQLPLPWPNTEYFGTLFRVMMLRFSFLIVDYEMLWWIILMPVALAGILSIVLLGISIVQGNITWG